MCVCVCVCVFVCVCVRARARVCVLTGAIEGTLSSKMLCLMLVYICFVSNFCVETNFVDLTEFAV